MREGIILGPERVKGIKGVILAGGRSKRFGRNKALEIVEERPLIQKVYSMLNKLFDDILVVTNKPESYSFLDCEIVKDRVEGIGPLAGIYTGLKHLYPAPCFFFPCDMPALNLNLIHYMCSLFHKRVDIVVPQSSQVHFEPLHAIYGPLCIPKIEEMLEKRIYRIFHLFERVRVLYVHPEIIKRFDPTLISFTNINTREDLERFLSNCKNNPKEAWE